MTSQIKVTVLDDGVIHCQEQIRQSDGKYHDGSRERFIDPGLGQAEGVLDAIRELTASDTRS